MQTSKKTVSLILSVLLFMLACVPVWAAQAETDTADASPLAVTMTANKDSYSTLGVATVTVTVSNTSQTPVANVSAAAIFDELAPVGRKSEVQKEAATLGAGESLSFTYQATLNKNAFSLNLFQRIFLWIVRLFRGGFTAPDNNFDNGRACIEAAQPMIFGKFTANARLQVWYGEIPTEPEWPEEPQEGTVSGKVFDAETLMPISGTAVQVEDNNSGSTESVWTTVTAADGSFSLLLPFGSYSISFHHNDYEYYDLSCNLSGEGCALGEVLLTAKPVEEEPVTFAGGDGTQTNPYQVATPEQLNLVREHLDSYFIQTADIDLAGWGNWEPIGKAHPRYGSTGMGNGISGEEQLFCGTYDGNSYKIKNLTIADSEVDPNFDSFGLFAGTKSATLQNISIENITIDINKYSTNYALTFEDTGITYSVCVGGIVGVCSDGTAQKTRILNCSVSGTIDVRYCSDAYVGGICGYGAPMNSRNDAQINVYANASCRSESDSKVYCGGITGHSRALGNSIENCANYGKITATAGNFLYLGGISGHGGALKNCVNIGDISGTRLYGSNTSSISSDCIVGGIVGYNSVSGKLIQCVNYGDINAFSNKYIVNSGIAAGGIAGIMAGAYGDYGDVRSCYNFNDYVTASYKTTEDTPRAKVGRIIGFGTEDRCYDCYSSDQTVVTGNTNTYYVDGVSLSADAFLQEDTYIDFDFENVWVIDPEIGGAVLK